MLNMGFQDDVETILQDVPAARQTLMFSATMPQWVRKLANKYCNNYIMVDLVGDTNTGAPLPSSHCITNLALSPCENWSSWNRVCRLCCLLHPPFARVHQPRARVCRHDEPGHQLPRLHGTSKPSCQTSPPCGPNHHLLSGRQDHCVLQHQARVRERRERRFSDDARRGAAW